MCGAGFGDHSRQAFACSCNRRPTDRKRDPLEDSRPRFRVARLGRESSGLDLSSTPSQKGHEKPT
nr:MAG TPA_asm: hypothetical protein [Caudoviricetes sp.]